MMSAMERDLDTLCQQLDDANALATLLGFTDTDDIEALRARAEALTLRTIGNRVHYRGLIEISNICSQDCCYCGIRRSNDHVARYTLTQPEILDAAQWCAAQGYGSVVLQGGENTSAAAVEFIADTVTRIKALTRNSQQPEGLGITLSLGVQTSDVYRRWFAAGAHRYLLRVETTDPQLFARIHPPEQTLDERIEALQALRDVGYQVGTGVMIGLPGQTLLQLARDVLFFKTFEIDMIGMGPYQPHADTPMADEPTMSATERLQRALNMIAVTRLVLPTANIASTTALQALSPEGRELGFSYGANITMPNLTPEAARQHYLLYDEKPLYNEDTEPFGDILKRRLAKLGREVGLYEWGDSRRFTDRHRT
ncbi:MAG: [FeFe] hydrogenase H-cluster radical SAM maturase HydE [Proteobacteria bacterium]|nr:[FeFe] hydrogenase H-cluster radical SAM maturase HydE [Pseudomonadota bacterium]